MNSVEQLIPKCEALIDAYHTGALGNCDLPEDLAPQFSEKEYESKLAYFTLPMSANYRRNSTQLWRAAFSSYNDPKTKKIFSVKEASRLSPDELRLLLLTHKVAMQPNRHTLTWSVISKTVAENWGTLERLLESSDYDFLVLKDLVQNKHRKGFPYLSGPKLFNYWCYILGEKCDVEFKNKRFIDIAIDSHVLNCSVKLGVINLDESSRLSREEIAARWRHQLQESYITPTDLNVPLWFWSRNGFVFEP